MVIVFKRSLSVPNKPSKSPISHHSRSISLPCRSHPLLSHLQEEISELKNWASKSSCRTSAWLCDGLNRLKDVHDTLVDLLQLPQSQELIRKRPQWVETVLEDFLCFVGVYGMFQTSIMAFKEDHLAAKAAIRRRDESKAALYVKARKKMAKEMAKLVKKIKENVVLVKTIERLSDSRIVSIGDVELAFVIEDVIEVSVLVSLAVFNGFATSFGSSKKMGFMGFKLAAGKGKREKVDESVVEFEHVETEMSSLKKKGDEELKMVLKKMRDMEECICGMESKCEKVFRGLINTRVALLNSLTQ